MARSSAVVSLRLASLPSTSVTASPAHSATAASSVRSAWPAAAAASWAARISAKRKPCGVCARHSPSRSTVAATRCSGPARFSVSASGTAATAPGDLAKRLQHAVDDVGGHERAHGVVDQHTSRAHAPPARARPLSTEGWRVAPPATGVIKLRMPLASGRFVACVILGLDHDLHGVDAGMPQKGASVRRQDGRGRRAGHTAWGPPRRRERRARRQRSGLRSSSWPSPWGRRSGQMPEPLALGRHCDNWLWWMLHFRTCGGMLSR